MPIWYTPCVMLATRTLVNASDPADIKQAGGMTNAHCMVSYSLSPRWALGAGYQFVDLDLEVDKTDSVQVYDIDFAGPMAYAWFRF